MRNNYELTYKDLKLECNPKMFNFETTADLKSLNAGILGQERGIRALQFGLSVDIKGYNLYLEGPSGTGKTMYTKEYLDTIAKKKKAPSDWCYIYNFVDPNEPIAVPFPAGKGKKFKEQMEHLVNDIKNGLKNTFNNKDFEKEKSLIQQQFEEKRNEILDKLNQKTNKQGFQIKASQTGIFMLPILNGKAIEEKEFDQLDEKIKKNFEEKSQAVQEQVFEVIKQIKTIEKENTKRIDDWQSNIALLTINMHVNALKSQYARNKKISTFLEDIKKDILKNVQLFIHDETPQVQAPIQPIPRPEATAPWLNYRVNLFIDNSELNGAPVIMDSNYAYHNLFGKLEYENQFGMLKTDYTMLKPGLLHKANGGYIVLQAKDLISNPIAYESLKKALLIHELNIENAVDQRSSMVLISLKPEPIPLDVKVLLVGSGQLYYTLLSADEDFRKLFKIKVEFEEEAIRNDENIFKLAKFVHEYCEKQGLLELDPSAMARLVEMASKMANDKLKISTKFSNIVDIVIEASTWATLDKSHIITRQYIDKALTERIERIKKFDKKYLQMIQEDTLLISTSGSVVGQINGLTVMTFGDYSFGKPAKITATTYMGKSGIINIEREIEMSGSTHSKGMLILTGYIGQTFAQDFPLALTGSICFEQLYNGVDGDSASSTEAYALLSSLSEVPIKQSIAVTGSVNQKGEIQPIGGVNEKIEGFYQICKLRGFNGEHGVIIPVQNVRHLHLSDEIIEDVKKGNFHIYAISNIEQGIEILTGVPAGKRDKFGNFPAGTINYLAYEKLKKFAKKAMVEK
ncbi:MAG: AAA family ATPase [Oscillospiraceae bacterium]|nr:AAA family ATPase [Oscillospiraceae bacterium]